MRFQNIACNLQTDKLALAAGPTDLDLSHERGGMEPGRAAPRCLVLGKGGQGHAKSRDFSKGMFAFRLNAINT